MAEGDASEGLLSRLTLQEGSCFLGGGNLRCFKNLAV